MPRDILSLSKLQYFNYPVMVGWQGADGFQYGIGHKLPTFRQDAVKLEVLDIGKRELFTIKLTEDRDGKLTDGPVQYLVFLANGKEVSTIVRLEKELGLGHLFTEGAEEE